MFKATLCFGGIYFYHFRVHICCGYL